MKLLITGLIVLGWFAAPTARADMNDAQEMPQTEMRFLANYDAKIAHLNDYTVTFSDDKTPLDTTLVAKNNPVTVKLIRSHKKKS